MMLRSTAASSGRVRRVGSFTGSGRSSGTHSGSEGVAVAPVTASAAMGSARARAGREAEEGTGSRGREGRCRGRGGVRGALGCLQRRAGKQEVAGACARASGTRPPAYWQEVEDGGDRGGLGRTVLDQHRSWAGSGGLHG